MYGTHLTGLTRPLAELYRLVPSNIPCLESSVMLWWHHNMVKYAKPHPPLLLRYTIVCESVIQWWLKFATGPCQSRLICDSHWHHNTCPPLIPFTVTVYSRLWRLKCVTTKNMNNSYEMIQSQQQRLYMFSKIEQLTALFLTYFPKSNFPILCLLYLPKIKNIMFYYQGTGATSQLHHTHLINMENQ